MSPQAPGVIAEKLYDQNDQRGAEDVSIYWPTNSTNSLIIFFGDCCMDLLANSLRRALVILCAAVMLFFWPGFIVTTLAHDQDQQDKRSSSTVGVALRAFVDEGRSNWSGTGPRPLTTIIWYPAASGSKLKAPDFGNP